jgi:hypothetical protein
MVSMFVIVDTHIDLDIAIYMLLMFNGKLSGKLE